MHKHLLACLLFAPLVVLHAQTPPAPAPAAPAATPASAAAPAAPAEETDTPLDKQMGAIRGAFNKLRKQVADPASNAASLELATKLREAAEASVKLIPERAADEPEAERAKFVADYQEKMKLFVAEAKKLEAALKDGKNEEAVTIVAALGKMQRQGHHAFRRPD